MTERGISVAEAARKLGVSIGYVYSLVWAGKLQGRKVNNQWRVSSSAVEARIKSKGE